MGRYRKECKNLAKWPSYLNSIHAISHAASLFFLIGFGVFCWMIYKKTRKVVKRAIKLKRKLR